MPGSAMRSADRRKKKPEPVPAKLREEFSGQGSKDIPPPQHRQNREKSPLVSQEEIKAETAEPAKSATSVDPGKPVKSNPPETGKNDNKTFSIKNILNGNTTSPDDLREDMPDKDDDELLTVQEDVDDFTERELLEQWRKFANQMRNSHPRLYNTLASNKPDIISQTNIRFEISNPLQQEALNKIKPELLSHLKRALNSNIELEICINENVRESRLYLPEDKYEKMLQKNPELAKFRQKFNLDFE